MPSDLVPSYGGVVGVVPPPAGLMPNFIHPPSAKRRIIIMNVIFPAISLIFITVRFYTEHALTHMWSVSDNLLLLAWIFALVFSVLSCVTIKFGFGRHLWDVTFAEFNVNYIKTWAIAGMFYGMSIMLTKLAILVFYLRFVDTSCKLKWTIHAVITITVVYSIITSFNWVFACQPLDKFWDLTITHGSCINIKSITIFNGVMNSITDAMILILPIVFFRKLQLPKRRKIAVIAIMVAGGGVFIISVIRTKVLIDTLTYTDATWQGVNDMLLWAVELNVAIICACLPQFKPFLRRFVPSLLGTSRVHSHPTYGSHARRRTLYSNNTCRPLPSREEDELPLDALKGISQKGNNVSLVSMETVGDNSERSVVV